jgi:hypothetical protein
MNWRGGMLRIGIAASIIWIGAVSWVAYEKIAVLNHIASLERQVATKWMMKMMDACPSRKADPNYDPFECIANYKDDAVPSLADIIARQKEQPAAPANDDDLFEPRELSVILRAYWPTIAKYSGYAIVPVVTIWFLGIWIVAGFSRR